MIQDAKKKFQELRSKFQLQKPWNDVVIFVLNILIAIPIFIILHQNIIDPEWPFQIDRILLFIALIALIQLILRLLQTITIICMGLYLIVLLYGTTIGNYGFTEVFEDYRSMMYLMLDNANPQDLILSKLLPFPNKTKILNAIDFQNPKVRNFALMATTQNFRDVKGYHEYRMIIQCFAVFKEIKEKNVKRKKLSDINANRWQMSDKNGRFQTNKNNTFGFFYKALNHLVCSTITAGNSTYCIEEKPEHLIDNEFCKIGSYPLDYNFGKLKPHYLIGMSVPPVMTAQIATEVFNQWISKI